MDKLQLTASALIIMVLTFILGAMIYLAVDTATSVHSSNVVFVLSPTFSPVPATHTARPVVVASSTPTFTPTEVPPPTWTVTFTPSPLPTPTPKPPTPTQTPTPSMTPTPLPPRRPTAIPIEVTPTSHPSDTLIIPTPVPRYHIPADALTVVVLGSDQRPDWTHWNTDVIQYFVIYPDVPSVKMLSIPRDLYVFLPPLRMSRINTADMYGVLYNYDGGGLGLLNQTMLYNLGITADYYVKVNFDGLIELVNILGGIEVPVHCRLEDYWPYPDENGEYHRIALEPGLHHMDGQLALWYSRSRKTTSVFSRERRQQQVLEAMWRKGKQANLLQAVPSLYPELNHLFETNLPVDKIFSLAMTATQLEMANVGVYNIGRWEVEPYVTYQGGNVFLPLYEEILPVLDAVIARPATNRALQNPIYVEVWNGTGNPNWDHLAADRMAHYGFIPIIGNPDRRDYAQTQIMFFGSTPKGSGLPLMQRLFRVAQENVLMHEDPNAPVKMRLIIGQDYVTCPY